MTIVVQLSEQKKAKHENFAYINVSMKNLSPIPNHPNVEQQPSGVQEYELLIYDS